MTIPSAFVTKGVGDKLTSGDANTLNADIQMALDKRSGQTDALASVVSCGGAGRIVDSYAFGLNADTTYLLSGGNTIIDASGILTVDRNYTLSNTGAVNGDRCTVIFNSANCVLNVKNSAGTLLIVLGAYVSGATAFAGVGESSWGDFEWNGAWTLVRSAKPAILTPTTFTASGTWTCPRGCFLVMLTGYGAGGGGGGGGCGTTVGTPNSACSGGGGGGSQLVYAIVPVTPGTAYAISIGVAGSGGAAGLAGSAGSNGGDGGDTLFGAIYTALGAQGGGGGPAALTATTIVQGGSPVRLRTAAISFPTSGGPTIFAPTAPGSGGAGINVSSTFQQPLPGVGNPAGFDGGSVLGNGGTSGSAVGGGGSGGGGGGPNGAGGRGAFGGSGSSSGVAAVAGLTGVAGAANTGAGGGGGGGGGQNTGGGTVGSGAIGAIGGTGQITVTPLR